MKRMITPLRNCNVRRLLMLSGGSSGPSASDRRYSMLRQVKITDPNPCMTRWYRLAVMSPAPVGIAALNLPSNGSCAETTGPAVNTSGSYTVAAWVKVNNAAATSTILSIDGANTSAFMLRIVNGQFQFYRTSADATNATLIGIGASKSTIPAVSGTWYHVAGIFDASVTPRRMTLYVNGEQRVTGTSTTAAWQAAGKTAIGRSILSGNYVDNLQGAIDDARFYGAILTGTQVQALYAMGFQPTFSLTPGKDLCIMPRGGTCQATILVNPLNGFTGSVSFSPSSLPAGVTTSYSPTSASDVTTLTLTADGTAALGSANVIVTGSNGGTMRTTTFALMVTAANAGDAFTWPAYTPNLNYDFRSEYPSLAAPTQVLNDVSNVVGTISSGWWCFRYGPNKNAAVTAAAWTPMLARLNKDFAYIRDVMHWPPDKRAKRGYFSTVYLYGSGLSTDNASNTDLGGWMSSVRYQNEDWPMILISYYPVQCFDPAYTGTDAGYQQGAVTHEGIHAVLADMPGCKKAAWFHEGGNTWLQGTAGAQQSGNYSSMGWLSAGAMIAPFMPIECYSGWLDDGSFGGPSAEGVYQGKDANNVTYTTWRNLLGGTQYGEAFPHFMGEIVSAGSVAWIWRNCPSRVLEGLATSTGGLGVAETRRLIMEYRARCAMCDFGDWSAAYQKLLTNNWNISIAPEGSPVWINAAPWTSTCYVSTTNTSGTLTPNSITLPGWSGANQIPLTVSGSAGTTVTVNFTPMGNNMTCQLVYRATDGSVVYGQPVASGECSVRLDKAVKNNVVIAVICNTDYLYKGEATRTAKYDYRLTPGTGVTATASINTQWFKTTPLPADLTATGGNGEVALSWSAVADATSYTIKRGASPGGPYAMLTTTTAATYINTDLANGTTYYYVVSATGSSGTSMNSREASATPLPPYVTTGNFGFETPSTATYAYNPSGGSWTFTASTSAGGSGIAKNSSTFTSGNAAAPQGTQVALLQKVATISQTISGFAPGRTYTIKFLACQRQNTSGGQDGETFDLKVDGTIIGSYEPVQARTNYAGFSATFTATATTHTISFVGTNVNTGDNTVFIDNIVITSPIPSISAIANQTVAYGAATDALPFTLNDADSAIPSLTVSATSSNAAVVPLDHIVPGGSGIARSVTITPATSGTSTITLTVSDGANTDSTSFTVTSQTAGQTWRKRYFASTENTGPGADMVDANGDGLVNLLEFFLNRDPVLPNPASTMPVIRKVGPNLTFTYTRSIAAMSETLGRVEWSDTLAAGSWSVAGVTETLLGDDGTVQSVRATVSAGEGRRFLRLKVTRP
ncbi:MAG: LamG domain-containing protein [Verrucomicrobia bacterium]|nr:LamG domain-containing protein [Verrucomicrobiota bacterium]